MSQTPPDSPRRLALLTDFTPDFLARQLRQEAAATGLDIEVMAVGPYQRPQQVMDPQSDLVAFSPHVICLALSGPMQWQRFLSQEPGPGRLRFGQLLLEACLAEWEALHRHLPGSEIWQTNLGTFPDGLSGQEALRDPAAFSFQERQFNHDLMQALIPHRFVRLLDWDAPLQWWGLQHAYDPRLWLTAAHPFSLDVLPTLVQPILQRWRSRSGRFLKVLVLDLDQTLWGGLAGEAGPHGLQIGQEGMGNVFRHFQLWVRQLKASGLLLAVASKNEPLVAREAFQANAQQVLSLDDFAVFKAGWEPKSEMIREIAGELNIGLDAFCFLDDNPFERNEVRAAIPAVTVPELPEDPAGWIPFLARSGLFDTASHSTADAHRTQWIQEERERRQHQRAFPDYAAYLQSLRMKARLAPLSEEHLARAHQLILRTNQFNLRTVRHSLEHLEACLHSPEWRGWLVGLRDTYGDYGWVSLILLHTGDATPRVAFLDTWVMSCRVFSRRLEHFILNQMTEDLRAAGFTRLEAEYRPTPKNAPFADLLPSLGFILARENRWCLDLATPARHETPVTLE